ncbi:hypothetical protein J2I47_04120 [Fibrella sp. HMF5335]|uniref:Outer membrane protein beta-barrel domain-containing protein n=1 Tax=Fibrella rubiginis TaxID=2817060 RepID=A0A939GDF4_9BACT|nr:hypothetical protein [Fibrella rubiginis]MBO0935728.1 hypothetical protein [Fibrella rubiginis]
MIYRNIATWGFLSALLVSVVSNEGLAQGRQNPKFLPYSEVGFGAGTSTYFGDLAGYSRPLKSLFTLPRWNLGLMYTRHFTPQLSARASFTWARIAGDDYTYGKSDPVKYAPLYVRNLQFRNDLKEFALIGMYDFIPGGRTPRNRPKVAPYFLLGVALVAHNPMGLTGRDNPDAGQQWVALQPLGTEGQGQPGYAKPYSLVTVSVPVGLGVRYALSESFNLAAEVRLTPTFSDYLDDVGGPYPNPNDLATPLAKAFSDRTLERLATRSGEDRQAGIDKIIATGQNPADIRARGGGGRIPIKDSYLLTSFQIHYIIPAKIRCP